MILQKSHQRHGASSKDQTYCSFDSFKNDNFVGHSIERVDLRWEKTDRIDGWNRFFLQATYTYTYKRGSLPLTMSCCSNKV